MNPRFEPHLHHFLAVQAGESNFPSLNPTPSAGLGMMRATQWGLEQGSNIVMLADVNQALSKVPGVWIGV